MGMLGITPAKDTWQWEYYGLHQPRILGNGNVRDYTSQGYLAMGILWITPAKDTWEWEC